MQSGNTSLHLAAANGHSDVCQLLIKHGADINRSGCNGQTPLMQACLSRKYETAKTLLAAGASTTDCDFDKNTALHLTCCFDGMDKSAAAARQTVDMIESLMGATNQIAGSHRAYIHAHNGKKETALHFAAKSHQLLICRCLVDKFGADVSVVDRHGDTPLHVSGKSPDLHEYFISRGADPDAKNKDQCTYLEIDDDNKNVTKLNPMDSTMKVLGNTAGNISTN